MLQSTPQSHDSEMWVSRQQRMRPVRDSCHLHEFNASAFVFDPMKSGLYGAIGSA